MTISISALPAPRAIAEFFAISATFAGPAAPMAHQDCDANCMYCWGPETD